MTSKQNNHQQAYGKVVLNHIALHVQDIAESGKFYKEVLQLEPIAEPFKDGLHLWYQIGSESQLHIIESPETVIKPEKTTHFSFCVNDIQAFMAHLDNFGIAYGNWEGTPKVPTVRGDGIKQIFFQDPNGYWIEINNDRTLVQPPKL